MREREEAGGTGAKSYEREKAWPSKNHSILSGGLHQLNNAADMFSATYILV
jgi:hypothetical protein